MEMMRQHHYIRKFFIYFLGFLIAINLIIVDLKLLGASDNPVVKYVVQQVVPEAEPTLPPPTPTEAPTEILAQSCSQGCLDIIKDATGSGQVQQAIGGGVNASTAVSSVKEFFIPIGTGFGSSDDWEDINGLQVYIDKNQYGDIKSAVLEASIRVPTKNQWVDVRLYNVTDNHPVWFSEARFAGGGDPMLIQSNSMVLDEGNKLYKLQMRTQLKYNAYVDQSRVKITTF